MDASIAVGRLIRELRQARVIGQDAFVREAVSIGRRQAARVLILANHAAEGDCQQREPREALGCNIESRASKVCRLPAAVHPVVGPIRRGRAFGRGSHSGSDGVGANE
jgi:hypothetical protein